MSGPIRDKFITKKFDTINYYKSEEYSTTRLHRVLLLPFTIESRRDKVVDEVTEAFHIELQKSAKFDVVVPQGFEDILAQIGRASCRERV